MYAGNVLGKVQIKDPSKRKVLSVRPTSFEKADLESPSVIEEMDSITPFDKAKWISESVSKSDRPDLQSAGTVVSGGRGIKVSFQTLIAYVMTQTKQNSLCLPTLLFVSLDFFIYWLKEW
jgi:electron transfer flavoprotein alpha subunit